MSACLTPVPPPPFLPPLPIPLSLQAKSYKGVVHGFASHDTMVQSPQAEACVEDIAMWVTTRVTTNKYSEQAY